MPPLKDPLLSVVLPVFNEELIIPRLFERVTAALEALGMRYEVIAVDDGSRDRSSAMLAELHARDPRWKLLSLSRNFGHQAAISAGLHYTEGDVVAVLDSDLQDPPELLGVLLEKWREQFQVVYAIRTRRKEGWPKRLAYFVFYRLLRMLSSIEIPLDAGDFCVMDRAVVDVLRALPERSRFVRGLRTWAGFRQIGVEVERQGRAAGEPKYTTSKLVKLALDGMVSFSSVPLKLAAWLGFAMCGLSVLSVVLLFVWRALDVTILGQRPGNAVGWTSLFALILLLSGTQMLILGILGEYVGRIFEEVKGREPWIIAAAHGFEGRPGAARLGWHALPRRD